MQYVLSLKDLVISFFGAGLLFAMGPKEDFPGTMGTLDTSKASALLPLTGLKKEASTFPNNE